MRYRLAAVLIALTGPAMAAGLNIGETKVRGPVYPTFGVHNPPSYSPCAEPDCLNRRGPGEPSDPLYPLQWVSDWTMYRVFKGYKQNPPPYASPPKGLIEGKDYTMSWGTTSYDATYTDANGTGAMMEYYEKYCLPRSERRRNDRVA